MQAGLPASLHRGRQPVRELYPGWQADRSYPAPAGMTVLILRHEKSGQEACWWLAGDDALLACHALALPPRQREKVMTALGPELAMLGHTLLSGEAPLPDRGELQRGGLTLLRALPASARIQLISLWFRKKQGSMTMTTPSALMEQTLQKDLSDRQSDHAHHDRAEDAGEKGRRNGAAQAGEGVSAFSAPLIDNLFGSRPAGPHTLACSPFTGRTLRAQLTMLTPKGVAYRFSDGEVEDGTPGFYLFWPGPDGEAMPAGARKPCLYYPAGNLLVGEGSFIALLPVFLLSWFVENPDCVEELKALEPFHLEDYGVGHASMLWDQIIPDEADSRMTGQEEAGQLLSSFPFSSLFTTGLLPGRRPRTPTEDMTAGTAADTDTDNATAPHGTSHPRQQDPSSP